MAISAVILTKNEEKNIDCCLESVSWCDERIVIDDNSTDKTVEIAKKHDAKVFSHALNNDFSMQRNFGLEKAEGEWVLFVDADEVVSEALKNEILKRAQDDTINGIYIKRQDHMWGKVLKHGEQGDVKLLRLARKNLPAGRQGAGKWKGMVHEVWDVTGPTETLENLLEHYPHPTLKEFLAEINFYSTLRAEELCKAGKRASWMSVLAYTKGKFFVDYFLKMGFMDGMRGFIVAMLMSFHSFLVRGKLWQMGKN